MDGLQVHRLKANHKPFFAEGQNFEKLFSEDSRPPEGGLFFVGVRRELWVSGGSGDG
jgi:hypothetical protein